MKKNIINLILSSAVVLAALTACNKEDEKYEQFTDNDIAPEQQMQKGHEEGYFTATFFPKTVDDENQDTRAAIEGYSNRIQSLVCLIYQKEADGEDYKFFIEEEVFSYDGSIKSRKWPYAEVSFKLPNGDYKAVFVANTQSSLFPGQNPSKQLLTDYTGSYNDARIHMPENITGQPLPFEEHNMFYLCTVDFSEHDFEVEGENPHVLLQRLVSGNVYGHDLINLNNLTNDLLNAIVENINNGDFLSQTIKGILKSKITETVTGIIDGIFDGGILGLLGGSLSTVTGYLTQILDGLLVGLLADELLDPIVQQLLGRLLANLNNLLFQPVFDSLNATLLGANGSLLGLNGLLNPWAHVNHVDIKYSSLPKNITFDRELKESYGEVTFNNVKIMDNDLGLKDATVYTLCGENKLETIDPVSEDMEDILDILKGLGILLDAVDENLLNGLLISMHKPLEYETGSNLMYTTRCQVLNATLLDTNPNGWNGEEVKIKIHVGDILMNSPIQSVLEGLLGKGTPLRGVLDLLDGVLKTVDLLGILGLRNLVDNLLVALLGDSNGNGGLVGNLIEGLSDGLGLKLPALNVNTIQLNGQWGATTVSDGTILKTDDTQ